MTKCFCSFLVEQGSIGEADMVKAFVLQAKDNPSLPKIIRDHSLLNDDQILEVYGHQAEKHCSFEQSCRDLGLWNPQLEERLEGIIVAEIPSIFKILIEADLIELDEIIIKLDEFISNVIESPSDYGLTVAS